MKKVVLTLVITILFSVLIIGDYGVLDANPAMGPELPPPGYRISENGTFNVPNLSREGSKYTLTGNINGTIVIEANNIILDGAQHTLEGEGKDSSGVWLQDKTNVTITNIRIRNFTVGITFSHYASRWEVNDNYTTNCTVQSSTIERCFYGLSFKWPINCTIKNNFITNNTFGIWSDGKSNTYRNNIINENKYGFGESDEAGNDVDDSNIINGKPIRYWINRYNETVPSTTSMVILRNCSRIRVQNLNLTGNGNGIVLYRTTDTEIFGNNITDNQGRGMEVLLSFNNSIIGNRITNNGDDGIREHGSGYNVVSNNLIQANDHGIYFCTTSTHEVIANNRIIANRAGSTLGICSYSNITGNLVLGNSGWGLGIGEGCFVARNNVTENNGTGIVFYGPNNIIVSNWVSKNKIGIETYKGVNNNISSNSIVKNTKFGIAFYGNSPEAGENNLVYRNNFIDNNGGGIQAFVKDLTIFDNKTRAVPGNANRWDDGVIGNYWSDHNDNNPYIINENNKDNHPLFEPQSFEALEMPSIESPPMLSDPSSPLTTESTSAEIHFLAIAIALTTLTIGIATALILLHFRKKRF